MSRVKRRAEPDRRDMLAEHERIMLRYAQMVGAAGRAIRPFTATLDALDAGLPVVVGHGYLIDLPAEPGPLVLEPDGSVGPVTAVYVDPAARPPDGQPLRARRRDHRLGPPGAGAPSGAGATDVPSRYPVGKGI